MTFVVARNPEEGGILLGGLGALGVGEMWVTEEPHHKDYPGYAEAQITEEIPRTLLGQPLSEIRSS